MNDKKQGRIQLILVVIFIVMSFVISASLNSKRGKVEQSSGGDRAVFVETVTLRPQQYPITIETTGIVQARNQVDIVPQVSGRVETVNEAFYAGGQFKKNELLFQIDPRDFTNEVNRLKAEVARAKTALNLEKAEVKASLAEWELLNPDKPPSDLVARKPQLAEARANVKAAEASLATVKLNLERSRFRFPFAGRVVESSLGKGQFVAAGQSYGRVFDASSLEVRASLSDEDWRWLSESEAPEITIQTKFRGKSINYSGYLKRNAALLEEQTRFANVVFGFKETSPDLVPGVFAQITVKGKQLDNIYLIPTEAMQRDQQLWEVDDESRLRALKGTILYRNDAYLMMQANALEAKQIITSKISGAYEGMAVEQEKEGADERPE
jgi:RND family efflux transporter MFP subunit